MKLKVLLTAMGSILLSANIHAQCANTIFSCTTTNNEVVEVCDSGSQIDYSFGKKGQKPEMALSVPRATASSYQPAEGHTAYLTVRIPNGNTIYEVFNEEFKFGDAAGINVYINNKLVTSIECKENSVTNNIHGIDLKPHDRD